MVEPPDEPLPSSYRHMQLDPRSDCPGPVAVTGQRGGRKSGVYDEWTCLRCGENNYGAYRNRRIEQRGQDLPERMTPMKLKLCIHRKAGAPGYGSDGAGAEIEIELDDELVGEPGKIVTAAQLWYGSLERAVDEQLRRMADKHPQPSASALAPVPAVAVERPRPTQGPPEGFEEYGYDQAAPGGGDRRNGNGQSNVYSAPPSRRNGNGQGNGAPRNDAPRNGKQLIGWANGHGKYDDLMGLSKAWNLGRIIDWTPDDVTAAFHELSRPAPVGWGGRG